MKNPSKILLVVCLLAFGSTAPVLRAEDNAASEGKKERPKGNLLIAIRENGDIWLDRQSIDLREVRNVIERLHTERPDDSVVIIADRASRAGVVAKVMDEVRAGGIKDVAIAADTAAGG